MRQRRSYFRICHLPNTLIMDGQIQREGSAAKYALNSEFTVTGDTDFYIVRRTALQVKFMNNTGASNSTFAGLNQKIGKGLTDHNAVRYLPKTGYQSLGWSKSKKASKADYKAGQNDD